MNFRYFVFLIVMLLTVLAPLPTLADLVSSFDKGNEGWQFTNDVTLSWRNAGSSKTVAIVSEAENNATPSSSTAVYDPNTKMLYLEKMLVVNEFNEFNEKETCEKWIFKATLKRQRQSIFKLITSSLEFVGILTGNNRGYITYNISTRELNIPYLKVLTIRNLDGTWTDEKPDLYKNIKLKLRYSDYLVSQIKAQCY